MKATSIPMTSPVKGSSSAQANPYENIPVAQPVAHSYLAPSSSRSPAMDGPEGDSFWRTLLRLGVFHALNSVLGMAGFVLVAVGTVFSICMLPLCCFGIVTFRLMLFFVGFLAELDVSLYNFISPPQEAVYVSVPRQNNFFEFTGVRMSPNLSSFSPGALLVALYFVTIKFVISLLSSIAISVAFSFPLSAFSDQGVQQSFFSNFLGFVGFVLVTVLLLCCGAALMKFAAGVSRAATRYFCCEKFSTYQYVARANAYPTALPTYGTAVNSVSADGNATGDRVIV